MKMGIHTPNSQCSSNSLITPILHVMQSATFGEAKKAQKYAQPGKHFCELTDIPNERLITNRFNNLFYRKNYIAR